MFETLAPDLATENLVDAATHISTQSRTTMQRTLENPVKCAGIGLHTGAPVTMWLKPAPANHGVTFVRTDVQDKENIIPATFDNVVATTLCTALGNKDDVRISTIEHLMAALWACKIDNAIIEIDGPEVPVMDGSTAPFIFLIDCAGMREQSEPRQYIQITKQIQVIDGDKSLTFLPADQFSMEFNIDFPSKAIAHQNYHFCGCERTFKSDISRARTFGFAEDVAQMRANGLALGGSLNNAIVIDGDKIMNDEGLRYTDEFVRHKVLDCVGDLFLASGPILGKVIAKRSGHALNNKALRALFAEPDSFKTTTRQTSSGVESTVAA